VIAGKERTKRRQSSASRRVKMVLRCLRHLRPLVPPRTAWIAQAH